MSSIESFSSAGIDENKEHFGALMFFQSHIPDQTILDSIPAFSQFKARVGYGKSLYKFLFETLPNRLPCRHAYENDFTEKRL